MCIPPPACTSRFRTSRSASLPTSSAWNYPYFVGGNRFRAGAATGNAVLYKPSEYAALTESRSESCCIEPASASQSLHAVGGRFAPTAEASQSTAYFLPARMRPAAYRPRSRSAHAEMQLDLAAKHPIYVREDVDLAAAAASLADGAMYNSAGKLLLGRANLCAQDVHDDFVNAFVRSIGIQGRRSTDERHLHRTLTRAPHRSRCSERQVPTRLRKCKSADRGKPHEISGPTSFAPTVLTTSITRWR